MSRLSSNGRPIDEHPACFGELRDSSAFATDGPALRQRLVDDGYVLLRGVLDPRVLLRAQRLIAAELARLGVLEPHGDREGSLLPARRGVSLYRVMDDLEVADLRAVTRQPALMNIFGAIFGETARPLDYTWPRAAGPGRSELPHADWPYMCRGTARLFTSWIPLMDLPRVMGPLMILEDSHRPHPQTRDYLERDADRLGMFDAVRLRHGALVHGARYSRRPDRVQKEFGTRWLTTDFCMGDVVIFSPRGLHATLDNRSHGFRASLDCRFQPVSEPVDPRFAGEFPRGHTQRDRNIFDALAGVRAALQRLRGRALPERRPRLPAVPNALGPRLSPVAEEGQASGMH